MRVRVGGGVGVGGMESVVMCAMIIMTCMSHCWLHWLQWLLVGSGSCWHSSCVCLT